MRGYRGCAMRLCRNRAGGRAAAPADRQPAAQAQGAGKKAIPKAPRVGLRPLRRFGSTDPGSGPKPTKQARNASLGAVPPTPKALVGVLSPASGLQEGGRMLRSEAAAPSAGRRKGRNPSSTVVGWGFARFGALEGPIRAPLERLGTGAKVPATRKTLPGRRIPNLAHDGNAIWACVGVNDIDERRRTVKAAPFSSRASDLRRLRPDMAVSGRSTPRHERIARLQGRWSIRVARSGEPGLRPAPPSSPRRAPGSTSACASSRDRPRAYRDGLRHPLPGLPGQRRGDPVLARLRRASKPHGAARLEITPPAPASGHMRVPSYHGAA